ncbi:hypothetical protein ZTR_11135 [Talaromyces verruculosus]|nr:hypothetical protein ZTR_11135 [Talaromyces verruculosus]
MVKAALTRKRTLKSKWSSDEEKLLVELREKNVEWEDIVRRFPGRNVNSCQVRYYKLKAMDKKYERWPRLALFNYHRLSTNIQANYKLKYHLLHEVKWPRLALFNYHRLSTNVQANCQDSLKYQLLQEVKWDPRVPMFNYHRCSTNIRANYMGRLNYHL